MASSKRSRVRMQRANRAKFKLNEPAKQIPGGDTRPSVHVGGELPDAVTRRLRLNRLLLVHDPGDVDKMVGQIGPDDLPVLRIMAQETAIAGNEPALRRQAIYLLGRFPDVENLGVLFVLVQTREGPHVRTAARNALAATGLTAAAPTLKEGLAARDPVEVRGAALAIARFARGVGTARARALLLTDERRPAVVRATTEVLDRLDGRIKPPRRRRRSSSAD